MRESGINRRTRKPGEIERNRKQHRDAHDPLTRIIRQVWRRHITSGTGIPAYTGHRCSSMVMAPPSQALALQATAWGSKDLKHCKGALNVVVTNAAILNWTRIYKARFLRPFTPQALDYSLLPRSNSCSPRISVHRSFPKPSRTVRQRIRGRRICECNNLHVKLIFVRTAI